MTAALRLLSTFFLRSELCAGHTEVSVPVLHSEVMCFA